MTIRYSRQFETRYPDSKDLIIRYFTIMMIFLLGALSCGPRELSNEELISNLLSTNRDERLKAAIAIGARGPRAAAAEKFLITALANDEHYLVRQHSARALAWVNRQSVTGLAALIGALADSQLPVRRAAAEALGEMGPFASSATAVLVTTLSEYWLAERAIQFLTPVMTEAAREQFQLSADKMLASLWALQLTIVDSLGKIGLDSPAVIDSIARVLNAPDVEGQERSLQALGKFGPKALPVRKQIEQRLNSSERSVRRNAAETLGKLQARESVPLLAKLLEDPNKDTRIAAAKALRTINTPAALEPLNTRAKLFIPQLQDRSWETRRDAADALEELDTTTAREALKNHRRFFPNS